MCAISTLSESPQLLTYIAHSRSTKRTRSGSVASDMPPPSAIREPTPLNGALAKPLPPPPPPPAPKAPPKNNKRGGARKPAVVTETSAVDPEEGA